MVAFSFKSRFCEPIDLGTKGGTIRDGLRPGLKPGVELQLYYGMRTKHCRLIARKQCLDVREITLDFDRGAIGLGGIGLVPIWTRQKELDAFAIFDGFRNWSDLDEFWRETRNEAISIYTGWHTRWLPWPKELAP